ncbi:hypothetical protein [Shouchella shacheensis]|uniref:hypothetical protein n=1 Tax=Shouchella shacheensis TaxID=1649580 RepID=UPI00073FEBE1|nr:hypothetical protein [Shouchella shacheensis]
MSELQREQIQQAIQNVGEAYQLAQASGNPQQMRNAAEQLRRVQQQVQQVKQQEDAQVFAQQQQALTQVRQQFQQAQAHAPPATNVNTDLQHTTNEYQ